MFLANNSLCAAKTGPPSCRASTIGAVCGELCIVDRWLLCTAGQWNPQSDAGITSQALPLVSCNIGGGLAEEGVPASSRIPLVFWNSRTLVCG